MQHIGTRFFASIFLTLFAVVSCAWPNSQYPSGVDGLEAYLGYTIPENAVDVQLDNRLGINGEFFLSFSAPSQQANEFVANICNGLLFENYDPFDAIASGIPLPGYIPIKVNAHYSYSPTATDKDYGNWCRGERGHIQRVAIHSVDNTSYLVRLQQFGNCPQSNEIPCFPIAEYVSPLSGQGLPLMVTGMRQVDDEFVVVYSEICLNTNVTYMISGLEENLIDSLTPYLESSVHIAVDNQGMPEAYISDYGTLLPIHSQISRGIFSYCLPANWNEGLHEMEIYITTPEGDEAVFSWQFRMSPV